jgi:hypothetical protein
MTKIHPEFGGHGVVMAEVGDSQPRTSWLASVDARRLGDGHAHCCRPHDLERVSRLAAAMPNPEMRSRHVTWQNVVSDSCREVVDPADVVKQAGSLAGC